MTNLPTQADQIRGLTNLLAGLLRQQPNMTLVIPQEDCVRDKGETINFDYSADGQIQIRLRASVTGDEKKFGIDTMADVSEFAPGLPEDTTSTLELHKDGSLWRLTKEGSKEEIGKVASVNAVSGGRLPVRLNNGDTITIAAGQITFTDI